MTTTANFEKKIEELSAKVHRRGINYSLDKLKASADQLGNPEEALPPVVHLAGTNGKGSTLAFLKQILRDSGYSVASFSSPHWESYRERLSISDKNSETMISEKDFVDYITRVQTQCSLYEELSEFEVLTLMSFLYFRDKKPDICLYETGLGGRLDTTNLLSPMLCIITKIDFDHEAILGDSLDKIASEKAGIIKPRIPLITTVNQDAIAFKVLEEKCQEMESPLHEISALKDLAKNAKLRGEHQKENAALAQAAAVLCRRQGFEKITNSVIKSGVETAELKGRYTVYEKKTKTIILDGAHNPSAITALIENLKNDYPDQSPSIIIGLKKDKDAKTLLNLVSDYSKDLYYCDFDTDFALSLSDAQAQCSVPLKSYTLGTDFPKSKLVVITGSLYFIPHFVQQLQ